MDRHRNSRSLLHLFTVLPLLVGHRYGKRYGEECNSVENSEKDLELHKIFARHGMKLIGDGASWRGKLVRFVSLLKTERMPGFLRKLRSIC